MKRDIVNVLCRVALAFGVTIALFSVLINPWRDVEAKIITAMFGVFGVHRASQAFGHQILVLPAHAGPFLATISPSCSALAALLAFAAISTFVVQGQPQRRLLAFSAAAAVILVCNFMRIGLSTYVGVRTNAQGLTVFHDWVGTAFGIMYILTAFTVYLWVLLPSNRTLLKEYANGA